MSAGAKAITLVESGRTFANDDDVTLVRRGDNRVRMRGVASSCDMGAKTMTVTVPAKSALVLGPKEQDRGGYSRYKRVK